jgi:hypothetical protein
MGGCIMPWQPKDLKYIGEANIKNSVSVGDMIFYRIDGVVKELKILSNKEIYTSNECVEFMLVINEDEDDVKKDLQDRSRKPDELEVLMNRTINPSQTVQELRNNIETITENFDWRVKTNNFNDYSFDYSSFDRKNKISSVLNS